jgi:hypothetical protein
MPRRFQFSLVVITAAICFAALAFLFAVGVDSPAQSRRPWLPKVYIGGIVVALGAFTSAAIAAIVFVARLYRRTNRQFQFSLRSLLVLATAAPVALWVISWQCDDVYQWLAMSATAAVVFLLLRL